MTVITGRSKIATTYGIVAASQPLAARAGVQVLERGGHAVDAAIATNAVMGLVQPHMNGIGGDLFAIVYHARTGTLSGLNSSGWAPAGLTPQLVKSRGAREMPAGGIHSVTVPGAVAGWHALRTRFGRLPLHDLLASAIYYAEHGFPVSDVIAGAWGALAEVIAPEPHAAATFLPGGRAPRAGELFGNPDLADPYVSSRTKGGRDSTKGASPMRFSRSRGKRAECWPPPTWRSSSPSGSIPSRRRTAAGPSTKSRRARRESRCC